MAAWDEHLAERLRSDVLTFAKIAELHAVEALGAVEEDDGQSAYRRGYDVLWNGQRVEVKSKTPSRKAKPPTAYVTITDVKLEVSDLFWFYLFGPSIDTLDVYAMTKDEVEGRLTPVSAGRGIFMDKVIKTGQPLWTSGKPVPRK